MKKLIVFLLICLLNVTFIFAQDAYIPLPGDDYTEEASSENESSDIPLPGSSDDEVNISQMKIEFSGYVEDTVNAEYLKNEKEDNVYNQTRARLNIFGGKKDKYDFAIGVIGDVYSGDKNVNLYDYLYEEDRNELIPGMESLLQYEIENEIYIQEAFITLYSSFLQFRIGRQKYYSGNGYAYSPIDFFNTKNPLDPGYETDGVDGVLLSVFMPFDITVEGFGHLNNEIKRADAQAKIKFQILSFDISMQYTYYNKLLTSYESLNDLATLQSLVTQTSEYSDYQYQYRNHFAGGSITGDLFGITVYSEGGYNWSKPVDEDKTIDFTENYARALVGFNYTFEMQLYIMAEYLYNGNGENEYSDISVYDKLRYYGGENISLVRHTVFSGISYPVTDLTDGSLYVISGIDDRSFIFNPMISYSVFSGAKIDLSAFIPYSKEKSTLSESGYGGFLRFKASF